jgi:hypothetical protein
VARAFATETEALSEALETIKSDGIKSFGKDAKTARH